MGYLLRQVLDLGLRPRWSGTALSGTGQLFDDSRVIPNANRLLCLHVGERRSILRDLLLDDSMLKMETQREVRAAKDFAKTAIWISVLLFVALACPNTLRILARYEPALGVTPKSTKPAVGKTVQWDASLPWAFAIRPSQRSRSSRWAA